MQATAQHDKLDCSTLSRVPVAPVEFARSLPAKSTSEILDTFSPTMAVVESSRFCVSRSVKTACERDDVSFMLVAATVRAYPSSTSVRSTTNLSLACEDVTTMGAGRPNRLPPNGELTFVPSSINRSTSSKF